MRSFLFPWCLTVVVFAHGIGPIVAQGAEPTPVAIPPDSAPAQAAQDPVSAPVQAVPSTDAKSAANHQLGTLLVDGTKVRCWPTGHSPCFEESFVKGTVLGVGRSDAGFRQVLLPLGPVGFVFKKFAGEMVGGKVQTTGKAVAFRYRPKSSEPPITSLPEHTELWVLGEQDDWWRVRNPNAECWLPETDVQVFDQAPATMTKAFAELQKTQLAEVQGYTAAIELRKVEVRLETERQKSLLLLQDQLGAELQKPVPEQALETVSKAAAEFLATLPETSVARPGTIELQKRIGQQKWVVEATAVRDQVPMPIKDLPTLRVDVRDPLERFQAVGFLRWERGLGGPGKYIVEKGGQRLLVVTCDSGRYELDLFKDKEVGMIGSRRRPSADSLRVIDVEKIEILAVPQVR